MTERRFYSLVARAGGERPGRRPGVESLCMATAQPMAAVQPEATAQPEVVDFGMLGINWDELLSGSRGDRAARAAGDAA